MFVADDPGVNRWPEKLVQDRVLVLGATREFCAPLLNGDLEAQRLVFARAVDEARCDGLRGVRVVGDYTSVVTDAFDQWIEWESLVEQLAAAHQVTALCGFDRSRLTLDEIHRLMVLHPRTVGNS